MSVPKLFAALPKTLRIAAQTVKFDFSPFPPEKRFWGEYKPDEHTIQVDPQQKTIERSVETIIHEALHAIWDCWHIPDDDKKEEEEIKRLAPALICLFRDNPKFLTWFVDAVRKLG